MDADRLTIDVIAVGACTASGTLLGGSVAGELGALVGTGIGLILGILIQRGRRS